MKARDRALQSVSTPRPREPGLSRRPADSATARRLPDAKLPSSLPASPTMSEKRPMSASRSITDSAPSVDRPAPPTADRPAMPERRTLPLPLNELIVGITIALIAIPQSVGFASIAGLPPATGLVSAVVMGLISALVSGSPRLIVGPAITASTMLLGVLRIVAPNEPQRWPALAAGVAVLVGLMTVAGSIIGIGRLARFVSRSVIVGLVIGSVLLTIGSQLAPMLGIRSSSESILLAMLWYVARNIGSAHVAPLAMASAVFALMMLGPRLGPRFPTAFVVLLLSAVAVWLMERFGAPVQFKSVGDFVFDSAVLPGLPSAPEGMTNLLAGAAAISLVGIFQNLAIAKALANRSGDELNTKREIHALGLANLGGGLAGGFPGSGSFARSALAEIVGGKTRLAQLCAAAATGGIALLAMPLLHFVTAPAIAGLLIATALLMVDWTELRALSRDVHDRPILITMIACVFVMPIHWALLIGLVASFIILLRRVSRVHLFEMVRNPQGAFREQEIDDRTGRSAVTMVQLEGPLFFAHADLLAKSLRIIFNRGPRVTILRMRRTQQIDFSILAALAGPVREYQQAGGHLIVCGLTPQMRAILLDSPLGDLLGPDFLLETTREVFGSAHVATQLAQMILDDRPAADREPFRLQHIEK